MKDGKKNQIKFNGEIEANNTLSLTPIDIEDIKASSSHGKKRKFTGDEQRIVLKAHKRGETIMSIVNRTDISATRAISIIRHSELNGDESNSNEKRKHYRSIGISQEIELELFKFLEENYDASVVEIKVFLTNKGAAVSKSTLCTYLSQEFITIKVKERSASQNINMDHVKMMRQMFVRQQCEEEWNCVFCGDFSVTRWVDPSIVSNSDLNDYPNPLISVAVAISINGLEHCSLKLGIINSENFAEFILEISKNLSNEPRHFIVENPAFAQNISSSLHHVFQLPPNSTFLSPLYRILPSIKLAIRRTLSTHPRLGGATRSDTIAQMSITIQQQLENIPTDLSAQFRHVKKYWPNVLLQQDISIDD